MGVIVFLYCVVSFPYIDKNPLLIDPIKIPKYVIAETKNTLDVLGINTEQLKDVKVVNDKILINHENALAVYVGDKWLKNCYYCKICMKFRTLNGSSMDNHFNTPKHKWVYNYHQTYIDFNAVLCLIREALLRKQHISEMNDYPSSFFCRFISDSRMLAALEVLAESVDYILITELNFVARIVIHIDGWTKHYLFEGVKAKYTLAGKNLERCLSLIYLPYVKHDRNIKKGHRTL